MPILPLPGCRAYSLALYISPCLPLGPCFALLYPSVRRIRLSVRVCPSGGGLVGGWEGWGEGDGRGEGGPSLPARLLVVLSQSLRVAAHLCEALGAGARAPARPTLLGWLDLCQNVPDLSLSQLEVQRGRQRLVGEYRTGA